MIFACVVAAIVLAVLGAAVLLHHCYAHMDDSPYTSLAKTEGCPAYCCFFQPADVHNHESDETWVLVAWTNALTLLIVGLSA